MEKKNTFSSEMVLALIVGGRTLETQLRERSWFDYRLLLQHAPGGIPQL
jgi:hypothetical protein